MLAIMGLLAVGGIIGYRYAVDKYRSNELWNNVKWISVQVMTDGSLQGMSSGDEMTVKSFSGDSDLILKRETAIGYSVRTGNLRESTCRQIRRDKPDWVEEVISNEGAGCQDGEENDIKIYFNGQLNSETTDEDRYKRCERDEDCGDCGKCSEEKICVDYDALCQAPTPYCINGSCEPCPVGETLNSSGKCQACPADENSTFRVTNDEAGAAACHKCGDNWIKASDGRCFSCYNASNAINIPNDETGQSECHRCSNRFVHQGQCDRCDLKWDIYWGVLKEECDSCPQRYWTSSGVCHYCEGTPNEDQTSCHWNCPAGQFGSNSACYSCDDPEMTRYTSTPETCDQCRGKRFYFSGNCISCESPGSALWFVPYERCIGCPQRYWDANNSCHYCKGTVSSDGKKCNWDCPEGQFGAGSTCYSCDDSTAHRSPSNAETCRLCAGSRFYDGQGNCTRCDVSYVVRWSVLKEDCLLCPQRYWTGGQCFLCPEKDSAEWQALSPTFQEQCND